jgi:hypothetical protein
MKHFALTACLLTLTACSSGTPQATSEQVNGYTVNVLTEYDGCTVYRLDGEERAVYWTKCKDAAPSTTQSFHKTGKSTRMRLVTTEVE